MEKHEAHRPQRGLLRVVKMPLLPAADALEGIPPLPRGNSLKGLFIKRVIIKIRVKIDCVSLLSHTRTHTHVPQASFHPAESIPASRSAANPSSLQTAWFVTFFFSKHKTKAPLCLRKEPSAGSCTGTPRPEDFEVYLSFKSQLLS